MRWSGTHAAPNVPAAAADEEAEQVAIDHKTAAIASAATARLAPQDDHGRQGVAMPVSARSRAGRASG